MLDYTLFGESHGPVVGVLLRQAAGEYADRLAAAQLEPVLELPEGCSLLPQAVMLMTMAAAIAKAKNFFIFLISFLQMN